MTAEPGSGASLPLLTEFSAASWNQSECSNGAGDTDFQFLAFLTCPDYSFGESDIVNMDDSTSIDQTLPQFADLFDSVTTHMRNLDQQVLQERRVCGEQYTTPPPYEETEISELKSFQVARTEKDRRGGKGNRTHTSVHLWKFVRDLLLSPQKDQNAIRWENREEGIFRVVCSDRFAQLWGEQKKNKCMNYEKLSRALRHYYKSGFLERVDKRLTYKFGKKAYGWKKDVAT